MPFKLLILSRSKPFDTWFPSNKGNSTMKDKKSGLEWYITLTHMGIKVFDGVNDGGGGDDNNFWTCWEEK